MEDQEWQTSDRSPKRSLQSYAKNNLVLARGAQRKYTLPVLPLTQIERAQLLHTLGLTAVRQGDLDIAKSLLRDAIETHPQHFDEAVRALGALEAG